MMKKLPVEMQSQLRTLEESFKRAGAEAELAAARELARDGLPVGEIYFMMRGVVSKPAIVLLRAEARSLEGNARK